MSYLENEIFQKAVMDAIFDEIVPADPNVTRIQEAFYPEKAYDNMDLLAYFNPTTSGMTLPTEPGADPRFVNLPAGWYRKYTVGYFGEGMKWDNNQLTKVKNPTKPDQLWGQEMVARGLAYLKSRWLVRKEWMASKILDSGTFTLQDNDIYFRYNQGSDVVATHLRLDGSVAANITHEDWSNGGTWATAADATPFKDIVGMLNLLADYGHEVESIWMRRKLANYAMRSAEAESWVEKVPDFAAGMLAFNIENLMKKAVRDGVAPIIDDRVYEQTAIIQNQCIGGTDTTITVDNDRWFANGDKVLLRNSDGDREYVTLTSSPSANVLTFSGGCTNNYGKGDSVSVYTKYMPAKKIIFKFRKSENTTAILPGAVELVKSESDMEARVHTYSVEAGEIPNKYLKIGLFVHCGLIHFYDNFATLTVLV